MRYKWGVCWAYNRQGSSLLGNDVGHGMNRLVRPGVAGLFLVLMLVALAAACGSSSERPIVFVSDIGGDAEIYSLDPEEGKATPLTDNQARDFNPQISPDGESVAYLTGEAGDLKINRIDWESESIVSLAGEVEDDQYPRWAPDGQRLAFLSHQDGEPSVYLMTRDGSKATMVTANSGLDYIGGWSPDGEWLVFHRNGNEADRGLWLRNPAGVNLVRLTDEPDSDPVWSPDGKHIAFVRTEGDNSDIYLISRKKDSDWRGDPDTTRLTKAEGDDTSPAWSPKGGNLAFVSYRTGSAEIFVMRGDGSKQSALTNNTADDLAPVWSPDGERLAFVSYLYGSGEIIVMKKDGSAQRRLTDNQAEDDSPDW